MTWGPVRDFQGYEVSDTGSIQSVDRIVIDSLGRQARYRGRVLKQIRDSAGYAVVNLSLNGKSYRRRVHELVADAFLGPRPPGLEVCHGPNGTGDNSVGNLRYDTHTENVRDSVRGRTHWESAKTECPKGHEYTPENTRWCRRGDGRGFRQCRECYP